MVPLSPFGSSAAIRKVLVIEDGMCTLASLGYPGRIRGNIQIPSSARFLRVVWNASQHWRAARLAYFNFKVDLNDITLEDCVCYGT